MVVPNTTIQLCHAQPHFTIWHTMNVARRLGTKRGQELERGATGIGIFRAARSGTVQCALVHLRIISDRLHRKTIGNQ